MTQQKNDLDAAAVFSGKILGRFALKPNPPLLSEYYVNNAWFETAQFDQAKPSAPLLEKKTKADIAIIGGGFTGLSSAYHLARKFPSKRIVFFRVSVEKSLHLMKELVSPRRPRRNHMEFQIHS